MHRQPTLVIYYFISFFCIVCLNDFVLLTVFSYLCCFFILFPHSGVSVNVQDLAPSCAGALFGECLFFIVSDQTAHLRKVIKFLPN